MRRVASRPSRVGIRISMSTTSGRIAVAGFHGLVDARDSVRREWRDSTSSCAVVAWMTMIANLDIDMRRLDDLCRRYGIARLEVFGSVARGEGSADSDVDLLYELIPGTSLGWEIEDLQDELSELFGRSVDLVSKRALHRELRPVVLAEACVLYAA
jgi:uncharacterized protein